MASNLTNVEIEQGLKKLLNISVRDESLSETALPEQKLEEDSGFLHKAFLSFQTLKPSSEDLLQDAPTFETEALTGHEKFPTLAHTSQNYLMENDIEFNRTQFGAGHNLLNHVVMAQPTGYENEIDGQQRDMVICSEDSCPVGVLGESQPLVNSTILFGTPDATKEILLNSKRKKRRKKPKIPKASTSLPSDILNSDLDNFPPLLSGNGCTLSAERGLLGVNQDPRAIAPAVANSMLQAAKTPTPHIFLKEIKKIQANTASVPQKSAIKLDLNEAEVIAVCGNAIARSNSSKIVTGIPVNPHKAVKALDAFNLSSFDQSPKSAIPETIFAILREQQILPLKKRSLSHPKAQYFCHLCEYHCDNLMTCKKHIKSNRHLTVKEVEELDMTLRQLPPPCEAQVKSINKLLIDMKDVHGLQQKEIYQREYIANDLRDCLKRQLPECCDVILYGSSMTGVGLKGCDVNLNLQVSTNSQLNPAHALKTAFDVIARCTSTYSDVKPDWGAKLPVVTFTHLATGLRCVLGLNCDASCETSKLIKEYVQLDCRVGWLCTLLRYWARECNIDRQMEGQLPPHAFDLMVIYFLQQIKVPVLPVLHELSDQENAYMSASQASEIWTSKNDTSIGFLWVELFRFYSLTFPSSSCVICIRESLPLTTTKKNWRGRKFAIEDPFSSKRNLARSISSNKVYDFILSCFKLSFHYFGIPQLANGPMFTMIPKPVGLNLNTCTAYGSNKSEDSRSNEERLYRIHQMKGSKGSKKNEQQSIDKGLPGIDGEMKDGQDERVSDEKQIAFSGSPNERKRVDSERTVDSEDSMKSITESDDDEPDLSAEPKGTDDAELEKIKKANEKMEEQKIKKMQLKYSSLPTPPELVTLIASLKENEYTYAFKWHCLTGGKLPVIECSLCQKEGHLKQNCPEDQLPTLFPLPPRNAKFTALLTETCYKIESIFKPSPKEIEDRKTILSELQKFIRNTYPDARLELFGSSCNGFGFQRSDLDICLTFGGNKFGGQNLNYVEIITFLAEKLRKCKSIYQVVAIPTAKVPIVKFIHRQSKLECDISLYNTLAQHNTKMLHMYSEIDYRVRILGYTMKYFAKLCDIGDASRGSLSSYAYTLMVIFFLQQRNPPVIPVLQELHDNEKPPPTKMVDGWNAWYYDNIKNLDKVWPHKGKNRESVGDLWIGLLRFYTETFDFKNYVVSIRQLQPLTRFEKLWNTKSIAIEDPFDLSHNLGMGVSRKMNNYIMKAFIKGRMIFGTPVLEVPANYSYIQDYLFDCDVLTDGPPPNDRCCRACGRIGHIVRDCPRKKGTNNQQRREDKAKVTKNKNNSSPAKEEPIKREVLSPRRQQEMPQAGVAGKSQNRLQQRVAQTEDRTGFDRQRFQPLLPKPRQDSPRHPLAASPPGHTNARGNLVPRQPFLYPMGIIPIKGFRTNPSMPMAPNDGNALRMMEPTMSHLVQPPFMAGAGFTNMPPHVRIRTEAFPPHFPR